MHKDETSGTWHIEGPLQWESKYYQFEVTAYHYATKKIEIMRSPDPYSRAASANGIRSLIGNVCFNTLVYTNDSCSSAHFLNQLLTIVDLTSTETQPSSWLEDKSPTPPPLGGATIYELHVRDFSSRDNQVPPQLR